MCAIELEGLVSTEQRYLPNTAVLITVLRAEDGSAVEITDFAPRFERWDRLYHPVMFVRRIRPLAGGPRITIRVRPLTDWGGRVPERTSGSQPHPLAAEGNDRFGSRPTPASPTSSASCRSCSTVRST